MSNQSQANINARQNAELKGIRSSTATHSSSIAGLQALQTKTFTNGSNPTETLSSATDKQFSVIGGVDLSTSSFSKINPIKVDDNGLLECKVIGNTSADGSGSSHNLHVDSNGNAKTIVVNSPAFIPHNTATAENVSQNISLATTLIGRETITDRASGKFLKVDSNGKLETKVDGLNFVNNELRTNLRTSGFDDSTTASISIANGTNHGVILNQQAELRVEDRICKGKLDTINTTLGTVNTNLGDIETEVAKTQTSVHTTNVSAIAPTSGGTTYDLGVNYFRFQKLKISGDMINTTPMNLYVQLSSDGSNWTWATGLGFVSVSGGGYGGSFFNTSIDNPMRYWRFYNNDSASATNVIDNLWYRVNQM